ncbi:hypothetical protein TRFO_16239 [Tritrichomonas foetus]|uniref:Myb-like DNA-binding domain containing protein n=1 Tax=Tritrichomonas foetus TaxID=1144522 RepID=A0A1J4KQB9_9EUKA|nr:hypothetical protein TRFO_16239 [Tritrichomonas foetus]|eukprot:OHT13497.1 hypothetical protein TRFO_16239 [Tritrichomonas foetus]
MGTVSPLHSLDLSKLHISNMIPPQYHSSPNQEGTNEIFSNRACCIQPVSPIFPNDQLSKCKVKSKDCQGNKSLCLNQNSPSNSSQSKSSIIKTYAKFHHKFSEEEDFRLRNLVTCFGAKKWVRIASMMPGRTARQCRDRYSNYLAPGFIQSEWSIEEDDLLLNKYLEYGSQWTRIREFFPNRTANSIKNRWNYSVSRRANALHVNKRSPKANENCPTSQPYDSCYHNINKEFLPNVDHKSQTVSGVQNNAEYQQKHKTHIAFEFTDSHSENSIEITSKSTTENLSDARLYEEFENFIVPFEYEGYWAQDDVIEENNYDGIELFSF